MSELHFRFDHLHVCSPHTERNQKLCASSQITQSLGFEKVQSAQHYNCLKANLPYATETVITGKRAW